MSEKVRIVNELVAEGYCIFEKCWKISWKVIRRTSQDRKIKKIFQKTLDKF